MYKWIYDPYDRKSTACYYTPDSGSASLQIYKSSNTSDDFRGLPDYTNDAHAKRIIELFGELAFLTGGSGLMTELGKKFQKETDQTSEIVESQAKGKAIILAGSCSQATLSQIDVFK